MQLKRSRESCRARKRGFGGVLDAIILLERVAFLTRKWKGGWTEEKQMTGDDTKRTRLDGFRKRRDLTGSAFLREALGKADKVEHMPGCVGREGSQEDPNQVQKPGELGLGG